MHSMETVSGDSIMCTIARSYTGHRVLIVTFEQRSMAERAIRCLVESGTGRDDRSRTQTAPRPNRVRQRQRSRARLLRRQSLSQ